VIIEISIDESLHVHLMEIELQLIINKIQYQGRSPQKTIGPPLQTCFPWCSCTV